MSWIDACDLTLDPNTANEHLLLSACKREVRFTKEKQPYPDHPERFDEVHQVMCREGLTGRCYWEVDWEGCADIGVAYKSLKRKGDQDTEVECSDKAWCFNITHWSGYTFTHRYVKTFIHALISDVKAFLARQRRLGVFLDWPAGILSFYLLSGSRKTLLHTFFTTFTEPLYPTFAVYVSNLLKLRMVHVSIPACVVGPRFKVASLKNQRVVFLFSEGSVKLHPRGDPRRKRRFIQVRTVRFLCVSGSVLGDRCSDLKTRPK